MLVKTQPVFPADSAVSLSNKSTRSKLEHHLQVAFIHTQKKQTTFRSTIEKNKSDELFKSLSNFIVINTLAKEPWVDVLIKAKKGANFLFNPYITAAKIHSTEKNDYITASVTLPGLEALIENSDVLGIEPSYVMYPDLDQGAQDIGADFVWDGYVNIENTITGQGVYVGILDGYPLKSHVTFRDENGESRIIETYGYGENPVASDNGTHVGGIAAGRGDANGNNRGIAYGAKLLYGDNGFGNVANLNSSNKVLNSFQDMIDKAKLDNKPLVVNLSAGTQLHPHDGSTYFEQILNEKIKDNIMLVKSAGNDGSAPNIHFAGNVPDNDSLEISVSIPPDDTDFEYLDNEFEVEIWYDKHIKLDVRVEGVDGAWTKWVDYASHETVEIGTDLSNESVTIHNTDGHMAYNSNNEDNVILLTFYDATLGDIISSGTYKIWLRPHSNSSGGEIDAYSSYKLEIKYKATGTNSFRRLVDFPDGDTEQSISLPGYASDVITVAAQWKESFGGSHAFFSSKGPSRIDLQEVVSKPDISAPGGYIRSAAETGDFDFAVMSGTSMSAPHVTGAIALLLQNFPELTAKQIKIIFNNTAKEISNNHSFINGTLTLDEMKEWGKGKLDILAAYEFMVGYIYNTTFVYKDKFQNAYKNHPYLTGLPVETVRQNAYGFYMQRFTNGVIIYQPEARDAYWISEAIYTKWADEDVYSALGLPTASEYKDHNNNSFETVDFENGQIYWDGSQLKVVLYDLPGIQVALAIDRSGSMDDYYPDAPEGYIAAAKIAANQFISFMDFNDNIAVVSFASTTTVDFSFSGIGSEENRLILQNIINSLKTGGGTSISQGIVAAQEELEKGNTQTRQVIILLSDGKSERQNIESVIATIPANTDVYSIALGSSSDQDILNYIAYSTDGSYYFSPAADDLQSLYLYIRSKLSGEQMLATFDGAITEDQQKDFPVFVDDLTSEAIFTVSFEGRQIDMELTSPGGVLINRDFAAKSPTITFTEGNTFDFYTIKSPQAGEWRVSIIGVDLPSAGHFTASVQAKSDLKMNVFLNKDEYQSGEPIIVSSKILENDQPVQKAFVFAEIQIPMESYFQQNFTGLENKNSFSEDVPQKRVQSKNFNSAAVQNAGVQYLSSVMGMELYDDGVHGDGGPDDGVYANILGNTGVDGSYTIKVKASGSTSSGSHFTREQATSTFVKGSLFETIITSVVPSQGRQGENINITIIGQNFDNTSSVSFSQPGVVVNNTTFINKNQIQVNITISPDALLVSHNISVTNSVGHAGVGTALFSVVSLSTTSYYDNFQDGDAVGWDPLTPQRWSVEVERGNYVYSLNTSEFGPLAGSSLGEYNLIDGLYLKDFTFKCLAKCPKDISVNPGADYGIVFGYQDDNNYYYVMFNSKQGQSEIFKVVDGQRTALKTFNAVLIQDNNFHELMIDCRNGTIHVLYDKQLVISAFDNTFGTGKIGVGSFSEAACFDDISVLPSSGQAPNGFIDTFQDGTADGWAPLNSQRWSVGIDENDYTYFINTSEFENFSGSRLGEFSLIDGLVSEDFVFVCQAKSPEDFSQNNSADFDLVFGYQDFNNYYYVMFNHNAELSEIFKVENGERYSLANAGRALVVKNVYYPIQLSRVGGRIEVTMDGQLVMSTDDDTFGPGLLGVGSFNDAAYFDDISISSSPVPVELSEFSYSLVGKNILLTWKTETESNNYGFEIQKAFGPGEINNNWSTIGFVKGNGTTTEAAEYSFLDPFSKAENTTYRLKHIDMDGSFEYSHYLYVQQETAKTFYVEQNYPNPFNPTTNIGYTIPEDGVVSIKIIDIQGREVITLVEKNKVAGSYTTTWNGKDQFGNNVASGMYLTVVKFKNQVKTNKIILMR